MSPMPSFVMSCVSSSYAAFAAPLLVPRRSLTTPSRSRCATRRRFVVASLSRGASDDSESLVHDSWRVYSKPGNLCVVCSGKGDTCCLFCYGEGTIRIGPETGRDSLVCPQCKGSGVEVCARCEGSGKRPATRFDLDTLKLVPNLTNEQVCQLELPKDSRDTDSDDTDAATAQPAEDEATETSSDPLQPQTEAAANGVPL